MIRYKMASKLVLDVNEGFCVSNLVRSICLCCLVILWDMTKTLCLYERMIVILHQIGEKILDISVTLYLKGVCLSICLCNPVRHNEDVMFKCDKQA